MLYLCISNVCGWEVAIAEYRAQRKTIPSIVLWNHIRLESYALKFQRLWPHFLQILCHQYIIVPNTHILQVWMRWWWEGLLYIFQFYIYTRTYEYLYAISLIENTSNFGICFGRRKYKSSTRVKRAWMMNFTKKSCGLFDRFPRHILHRAANGLCNDLSDNLFNTRCVTLFYRFTDYNFVNP